MHSHKESIKFIERSYKLYEQKMYQVAFSILHDALLAEDAVQEAFLKLMKSNIYFAEPESDDCKRYMIIVIKHASINIYNHRKKEAEIMYFSGEDARIKDISDRNDTDEGDMEELISCLPSKYYAVVNCLVIKSLSVKETAAELGISEAAVRKRFERAKVLLKTAQKGEGKYEKGSKLYKSGIF